MGKRIISQRRGKGSMTYRSHSFRHVAEVKHRPYDDIERSGNISGRVIDLVHCPGHTAVLAIVKYDNGELGTVFANKGLSTKSVIMSGNDVLIKEGNTTSLKNIPLGTSIYNIEAKAGDGGKFVRVAGTSAIIVAKSKDTILVQMPSKKQKTFDEKCRATIGIISGTGRTEKPFVKAGTRHHAMRARSKLYPKTSGVAMNAVDHPFGSGRGRHIGKSKVAPRYAPPGRNVGSLRARRTGKRR